MKRKWKESCGYDICMDECCPEFEGVPLTNADRIRAMSDAELAEALSNAIHCRTCYARNVCKISADSNCQQDHLTWLKQPVEGDG